MEDVPRYSLGDAVERMLEVSLVDWRDHYAPGARVPELMAGPLSSVDLVCHVRPGGVVDLTVTCFGRRHHENEVFFAKLHRLNGVYAFDTYHLG